MVNSSSPAWTPATFRQEQRLPLHAKKVIKRHHRHIAKWFAQTNSAPASTVSKLFGISRLLSILSPSLTATLQKTPICDRAKRHQKLTTIQFAI
jgi:hypothetical protein